MQQIYATLEQRYGDHHVAVVGDEIITRSDVLIHLSRTGLKNDPTEGMEGLTEMQVLEARYLAALEELLDAKLKTQGGENLGFDPDLIERATNSAFLNQIERWGGQQKATEALKGMNFTPARLKEYFPAEAGAIDGYLEQIRAALRGSAGFFAEKAVPPLVSKAWPMGIMAPSKTITGHSTDS